MKKGDLVQTLDANGEIRGLGLFMGSFVPAERGMTAYEMIDQSEQCDQTSVSINTRTKHFEVFIDGNVRYMNAVYWSLLPVSDD